MELAEKLSDQLLMIANCHLGIQFRGSCDMEQLHAPSKLSLTRAYSFRMQNFSFEAAFCIPGLSGPYVDIKCPTVDIHKSNRTAST